MTVDPTFQLGNPFSQHHNLSFRVVVREVARVGVVETHHVASFVCS
jgi:hypothetical protein